MPGFPQEKEQCPGMFISIYFSEAVKFPNNDFLMKHDIL